jgi:hypothetical protein
MEKTEEDLKNTPENGRNVRRSTVRQNDHHKYKTLTGRWPNTLMMLNCDYSCGLG